MATSRSRLCHVLILLLVGLMLPGCVSLDISVEAIEKAEVRFSVVPEGTTKVSPGHVAEPAYDSAVGNYMLLVFRSDGRLYRRLFSPDQASSTVIMDKNTEYHIHAVSNLDTSSGLFSALNSVTTESGFLGVSYTLSDAWQPGNGWLAKACVTRTFTQDNETVSLSLDRVVAKITVQCSFTADEADPDMFDYDGIYLINTVDEMTFGGDAVRYDNCSVSLVSDFSGDSDLYPGEYYAAGDPRDGRYLDDFYLGTEYWYEPFSSLCELNSATGIYRDPNVYTMYCLANPATTTSYGNLRHDANVARQTRIVVSVWDDASGFVFAVPFTVKTGNGWLEPNIWYSAGLTISLDRSSDINQANRHDGMDWDSSGSSLYSDIFVRGWTPYTYTETL